MKALFSTLLLLTLAACGFTPMYGSGAGNVPAGLDTVEIALIPDQSGVYLRNILIDHFYRDGYPADPRYILGSSEVHEDVEDIDITTSSEATRKQIKLNMTITLIDKATDKPVLERTVTALTSYNVLGSQFTTRVSENDAREAALEDLARQIETQVALYFKR